MRRFNPAAVAIIGSGLVILLVIIVFARGRNADQDKLTDNQAAATTASGPEQRCASNRTYDLIKLELFRRAARTRGSDQAAFDRLSAYSVVRMEKPLLTSHDEELGTIRCSGRLALDLPPGVAVVGGRRALSADIDYVLQPAADGSGDVVILEGADPIIVPLATLAQTGSRVSPPQGPAPAVTLDDGIGAAAQPPGTLTPAVPAPAVREPTPAPTATARPSFNCRYARTRGEIAVCNDGGLAALDRQMTGEYYRAIASADGRQRQVLTSTRDSFLRYRDQCPSDACIAQTYRGRIREIQDIMAGRWRP